MNISNSLLAVICIVLVVALAVIVMENPYHSKSTVAGAVENAGSSIENMGKRMDTNRSVGERIGDSIENVGKDLRQ